MENVIEIETKQILKEKEEKNSCVQKQHRGKWGKHQLVVGWHRIFTWDLYLPSETKGKKHRFSDSQ